MNLLTPRQPVGSRFQIGRVFATPAALDVIARSNASITDLLSRHVAGDFGDLAECDQRQNEIAIETGERILSSYLLADNQTVWLITERDRSVTTFLLPGDY